MAYNPQYQAVFSNDPEMVVKILLAKKDGPVVETTEFIISECEFNDSSEDNTILARELTFTIFADDNTGITWETFLAGSYDEWMVTVTVDDQPYFSGFLTPEEGNAAFLPKPYDIKLRGTNGVKLLKDVALTDLSGVKFHGKFTGIEFIAACLQKTLLDLPFRAYGSIYNDDMDNRADNPTAHYLHQIKFDHRTFMKDATTFMSCYDVLIAILGRSSRLFYWNGIWVIFYMPEHQYKPLGLWYTNYQADGTISGGGQETEDVSAVGSAELIYPQEENQLISTSFAIKFAKTNFNYNAWPEIPLNSKFERGTKIGSGTDADGNPYTDYSIDDWTATMADITATPPNFNFDLVEGDLFVRRTYNLYGIELRREIFFETPTTASPGGAYVKWLIAEILPVNQGDKIKFSAALKFDNDFSGSGDTFAIIGRVYLIPDVGTDYYAMTNNAGGQETSFGKWEKESGTPPDFISVDIPADSDSTKYKSITIESDSIPVKGTLYIALQHGNDGTNAGGNKWFTGFEFEYLPFVVNGYIQVKGDYWQHSQNANQIDKDEGEIQISDTVVRVLQGCMFNADGVTATNPTWYRYGLAESRHFKELVNIGRYNLGYRRFWRIEGSFTGLQYSTIANPLIQNPLSYHKNYRFTDLTDPRDFILVPPLRMDVCTGVISAVFEEVYNPALLTNHGADMYRVIQGLIAAVAGVGATLQRVPPDERLMKLVSLAGETVTDITVGAGGAGNFPSLTLNTQFTEGANNIAYLTIGEDIAIGNSFYFKVGSQDVFYTVVNIIEQSDGTQTGDSREFNYIFSN